MIDETFPKTETRFAKERENPWSARVIDLVVDEEEQYKTLTGLFQRQTHAKDGTHYVVAYNPHEMKGDLAECFVLAAGGSQELHKRFKWVAIEGPAAPDQSNIADLLHQFEALIREGDG